jgi:hypothetical protein
MGSDLTQTKFRTENVNMIYPGLPICRSSPSSTVDSDNQALSKQVLYSSKLETKEKLRFIVSNHKH